MPATQPTPRTRPTSARRKRSVRSTRVLLADDDIEMRKLLAVALKDAGYDVVDVPDGSDLLRQLAYRRSDAGFLADIDLIVTDVRMPGVDGFEVLQALRDKDWATAIVLISAFADDEMRARAERLGATALLSKPFSLKDFLFTVKSVAPPS